jgi:HK97 family phage portal protein
VGRLGDFFFGAPALPAAPVKGVDISYADTDNFTRNRVSVRTVVYNDTGGAFGSYGLMYRRQPAVRAVVDLLARNIGQLNPKVYERISSTDRVEVSDHPLAVLLRNPNRDTTRFRFLRDTVADIAIYDRAYWRILRAGRAIAITRIPPGAMTLDRTPTGARIYRLPNGTTVPRTELVVFSGYSPEGGDDGVSPLETLRRVLQEEAAATQHREMSWINGPRPAGFILRPMEAPEWGGEARERFREEFTSSYAGSQNAGKVPVLEEGMTFAAGPTFSAKDTDYIAGRRLTYEEVAIAYGVPPTMVGMGSETKSNAEEFHRQMYQDVLGPWLRMLQDEIELQLLPEFELLGPENVYVEFNLAEKLKGSFEEQGRTLVTAVGVPYMTVNEGRARLNLPQIDDEWADTPVQPMNVMYGGQPAVTVPTEDPSTPAVASFSPAVKSKPAPRGAISRRDRAAKDHEALFRRHFDRQRKALTVKALPDADRWDRELTADLYVLATQVARRNGRLAAQQIKGVYDEARTLAWLLENSRITAENVNRVTFEALEAAEDGDAVADVFDTASGSRSEQLGLGRATLLIGFARTEAAKHSQDADGRQRTKTWVVTSKNSRHPSLNGETVPVGESFSNGAQWPGDPTLGADDVAHCQCLVDLS